MITEKQTFPAAAARLTKTLASATSNGNEVKSAISRFWELLPGATNEEVAAAMQSLAGVFEATPVENAIHAIMLCGYLVEKGYEGKSFIGEQGQV